MQTLLKKAIKVLRNNDEGNYTVPSRKLYPHQWAWDSAFSAIGWSFIDPNRALAEIERLFEFQWEDGKIPQIIFNPDYTHYFPGPDFWQAGNTSSITQPPVYATALKYIMEANADKKRIRKLIPEVEKIHEFFRKHRDPENKNLVSVVHPWESGMDNSPSWDEPLENVIIDSKLSFKRKDIHSEKDKKNRPTDTQYQKYTTLVKQLKKNFFLSCDFNVYDPMMTVMLAISEWDLAYLCKTLGVETNAEERFINYKTSLSDILRNDSGNSYDAYDCLTNTGIESPSIASIFPLLIGNDENSLLNRLKSNYLCEYGIRSTDKNSDQYDPQCYWRGPVWMNINWLFRDYLTTNQQESILNHIDNTGFFEYFNPETGKGLGADNFSWTAALTIETIFRLRNKK